MAEQIAAYLRALEDDLRGRLPAAQVASILDESASHLYELSEELGSEERAVAKFGNPRRCARKILREATPVPNPWRASILPISVTLIYVTFTFMLPLPWLEQMLKPVAGFDSAVSLLETATMLLVFIGFLRARQILFKPIAALSLVALIAFTGMLYSFGNRVTIPGDEGLIVSRSSDGLEVFNKAIEGEKSDWEKSASKLKEGIAFYTGSGEPKKVPESLKFYGSNLLNPATIVATLTIQDRSDGWWSCISPIFSNESDAVGGADPDFETTRASWQRDGASALARVEKEIERNRNLLAAGPAVYRQPMWLGLAGHLPRAFQFTIRCTATLFYFNCFSWLIWMVYRRFRLPRRRFA